MRTLGKKQSVNPISLGARVIANVVTPLGLEPADQKFVNDELKWLFSAAGNFQQVYQTVQKRLAEENTRLIKKFALDILSDRKREQEMAKIRPQLWQEEVERSQPITEPIPPEAEGLAQANNKLLSNLSDYKLENWSKTVETRLKNINTHLRNLDRLLERETLMGEEGKRNVALQNKIKLHRSNIIEITQEIAEVFNKTYGILVTSPMQLIQLLEEY
jgi:hypothetical protein